MAVPAQAGYRRRDAQLADPDDANYQPGRLEAGPCGWPHAGRHRATDRASSTSLPDVDPWLPSPICPKRRRSCASRCMSSPMLPRPGLLPRLLEPFAKRDLIVDAFEAPRRRRPAGDDPDMRTWWWIARTGARSTLRSPNGRWFQSAELTDIREELAGDIAGGTLLPLLLSLPLIALLVWWSVALATHSLRRMSHEIGHGDPERMTPLDPAQVPLEARGLVDAINGACCNGWTLPWRAHLRGRCRARTAHAHQRAEGACRQRMPCRRRERTRSVPAAADRQRAARTSGGAVAVLESRGSTDAWRVRG